MELKVYPVSRLSFPCLMDHIVTRKALVRELPRSLRGWHDLLLMSVTLGLNDKLAIFHCLANDPDTGGRPLSDFIKRLGVEYKAIHWGLVRARPEELHAVHQLYQSWYNIFDLFSFLLMTPVRQNNFLAAQSLAASLGQGCHVGLAELKNRYVSLSIDEASLQETMQKYIRNDLCSALRSVVPFLELPCEAWGPVEAWECIFKKIEVIRPELLDFTSLRHRIVGEPANKDDFIKKYHGCDHSDVQDAPPPVLEAEEDKRIPMPDWLKLSLHSEEEASRSQPNDANLPDWLKINDQNESSRDENAGNSSFERTKKALIFRNDQRSVTLDLVGKRQVAVFPEHRLVFNEREFLTLLRESISLSLEVKRGIIENFASLSQFQVDELIKVFREEQTMFAALGQKHQGQVDGLRLHHRGEYKKMIEDILSSRHSQQQNR